MPPVYLPVSSGPLRQGEFISGLIEPRTRPEGLVSTGPGTNLTTDLKEHPFAVILTQDCELEGDHRARNSDPIDEKKLIDVVLLCDVFSIEDVRKIARRIGFDSKAFKRIQQNRDERFHYLQAVASNEDAMGNAFGAQGVDFKRVFALTPELVYGQIGHNAKRRFKLDSPYLENLIVRFYAYQSRIALPVPHAF